MVLGSNNIPICKFRVISHKTHNHGFFSGLTVTWLKESLVALGCCFVHNVFSVSILCFLQKNLFYLCEIVLCPRSQMLFYSLFITDQMTSNSNVASCYWWGIHWLVDYGKKLSKLKIDWVITICNLRTRCSFLFVFTSFSCFGCYLWSWVLSLYGFIYWLTNAYEFKFN